MKKVLITSGCSFTMENWNWPAHLASEIDLKLINVGMASQGNGLISRKLIYTVETALKKYSPDEIMVGVMWSGTDRAEYHTHDGSDVIHWGFKIIDPTTKNPTNVVEGLYNWRIMNHHWKNKESLNYYKNFHTSVYGMVSTIEHVLRVQWYLKQLGIDYFMTTYMDIFDDNYLTENKEVAHLFKIVDFNTFLQIKGCYEWVKENYSELGLPSNDKTATHPTSFGHKKFSEEVIIPFLKEKKII